MSALTPFHRPLLVRMTLETDWNPEPARVLWEVLVCTYVLQIEFHKPLIISSYQAAYMTDDQLFSGSKDRFLFSPCLGCIRMPRTWVAPQSSTEQLTEAKQFVKCLNFLLISEAENCHPLTSGGSCAELFTLHKAKPLVSVWPLLSANISSRLPQHLWLSS